MVAEITDDTSVVMRSMCTMLEKDMANDAIKMPMAPSMPSNKVQSRRNPAGK
jgi:hypothetical protein